ncbi:MAG: glycerol-3-phosphate 1-O-acyltransferase PlsY [Bacilli bacterium]
MIENILLTFVPMLVGYLLASIPSGVWIGQILFRKDVRKLGSGGSGMTNVYRNFGRGAAILVFIMDLSKSILPVWLASTFVFSWTHLAIDNEFLGQLAIMLTGIGTGLGHCYPIFAQFRGGKAVSSAGSFMLMTNWLIALTGLAVMLSIIKLKKIVSIGSILGHLFAVLLTLLLWIPSLSELGMWNGVQSGWLFSLTNFLIWLLLVYRHKENIQRLLAGKELDFKKKTT